MKLSKKKYKIALSGTPILNEPTDAYGVLKWLNVEKSTIINRNKKASIEWE